MNALWAVARKSDNLVIGIFRETEALFHNIEHHLITDWRTGEDILPEDAPVFIYQIVTDL